MYKKVPENTSISIHTLRVEGDSKLFGWETDTTDISIHTLRVEGDICTGGRSSVFSTFQSTPSVWRVTLKELLTTKFMIV